MILLLSILLLLETGHTSENRTTEQRSPQSFSVRELYDWQVDLESETKAVVGPIDAERVLRVRLTHNRGPEINERAEPRDPLANPNHRAEKVTLCIFERACRTVALIENPELPYSEIDFTEDLARTGLANEKIFLTLKREQPSILPSLNLSILVESDQTVELPKHITIIDETNL